MWMMGYNDRGEANMQDSFNGRKLRQLIPRPTHTTSTHNSNTTSSPCLGHIHGADLLALNHHLTTAAEQSKRSEFNTQQVVVSSRWNPTPEQLQILEELYRRGIRTPSTDHIQHITAQLRRYGKIEGKNVFYWFQNHKARERQKRRRQLESASDEQFRDMEDMERKESGANRTGFEVEETKNWAPPTNCTSTIAENTVSIQRAGKATGEAECRADGWVQFEEREMLHTRSLAERNATWQKGMPCSSPHTNLINTTTTTTTTSRTMDPKIINAQDLTIFLGPYRENHSQLISVGNDECDESQTLQLFPLRSSDGNLNSSEKESEISIESMNPNFTPCQFFEFLPLKN